MNAESVERKKLAETLRQLFRFHRLHLLLPLALTACDRGTPTFDAVEVGPPVKVLLTIPAAEAIDVPVDQSIRVQFDRFLSPLSVLRQSICIAAVGPTTKDSGRPGCEQFPKPEYDPIDRVAVWKPSHPLKPGVRYTVVVRAPENEEDQDGIRAFDGAPLEQSFVFAFTTERRLPCSTDTDCIEPASCGCEDDGCSRKTCRLPSNEPKRSIDYCYDSPRYCAWPRNGCSPPRLVRATTSGPRQQLNACSEGSARCHTGGGSDKPIFRGVAHPPFGSELSLARDGIRNYIGQVALQTAREASPTRINRLGVPFAVNMPYVDPGFPANSYLLWKLVLGMQGTDVNIETPVFSDDGYRCEDLPQGPLVDGGPDGSCPAEAPIPTALPIVKAGDEQPGPVEPWIPRALSRPIAEGEYERLRRSLHGGGMPYGPDERIYVASLRTIQAWIAAGAATPDCR